MATAVMLVIVVLVRVMRVGVMATIMIWANDVNGLSSLRHARKCTIIALSLDFDKGGWRANERKNAEDGIVMVAADFLGKM
jgi:hypothetical protein